MGGAHTSSVVPHPDTTPLWPAVGYDPALASGMGVIKSEDVSNGTTGFDICLISYTLSGLVLNM